MAYRYLLRSLFALGLFLVFSGCGKKGEQEVKIPEGILSEAVFTKVLTDFALAESAANMNIKNSHFQKTDSVYAFNPLKENNITQAQYDSAVSFYTNQPELYKRVYENVLAALSEMQAKRNSFLKDSATK